MSLAIIQSSYLLILANVVFKDDFDGMVQHWHDDRLFKVVFLSLELCKFMAITIFLQSLNLES